MQNKQYKCKCGYIFGKIVNKGFVQGSLPECPSCKSGDVKSISYIEKKKKK